MNKIVNEGKSAMDKIKAGVDLVANPVKSTIGPLGHLVILSESVVANYDIQNYPIIVSKDGYRVAQSITSSDPEINVGVRMIQEVLEKQMQDAGDATSTAALLTQSILEGGLKLIEEGISHVEINEGIDVAVSYVVEELKKMSIDINGDVEKVRQIATLTSNGDEVIGKLISEAFEKIGKDGVINLEESKGTATTIQISDGIKFHRGWASPYFVTNKSKAECELINPYILIYDRPINVLKDLMPLLQHIFNANTATGVKRPLMIFCDASAGDALATLTFNNAQGNLQSCVVEMAFLGDKKKEFMEDIAAATGGLFISELKGVALENVVIEQLGQSQKIIVGKNETVIISGSKNEKIYNSLLESLKELEEKEEEGEEKELLKKRIARLKGSVATLSVGATTEVEMKEKKDRADDAIRSVRASLEEGYIPASGTVFMRIPKMQHQTGNKELGGSLLIMSVLDKSFRQICLNAGIDSEKRIDTKSGKSLYTLVLEKSGNMGYNARTKQIEDLVKSGIIEPTKSNRCALQNAASMVKAILSSKYMVTDCL